MSSYEENNKYLIVYVDELRKKQKILKKNIKIEANQASIVILFE